MEWIKHERIRKERQQLLRDQIIPDKEPDHWSAVEPFLDEAVNTLKEPDRHLIVMRFFQKLSLRELGLSLGIGEDAARKRVGRSVEQLKQWFRKKGMGSSTAGLSACLTYSSTKAAPAALMTTVLKTSLSIPTVSTLSSNLIFHWVTLMKTKTILITAIGMVAITGLVLVNRDDSTHKPISKDDSAGNSSAENQVRTAEEPPASIMQRVGQLQSARKQPVEDLDMLATFQKLLHSNQEITRGSKDPASVFLEGIPVADRKPLWDLVNEALDSPQLNVQIRATKLLPLMWPEHVESLPKLYERMRSHDTPSSQLLDATFYAVGQIIKEPSQFNDYFNAVMEGSEMAKQQMALQTPVLLSGLQGDTGIITEAIQPYLEDPLPSNRLIAAQILAQTNGPLVEDVVEILASTLSSLPDSNNDQQMFNLSLLWKLGPKAESAVPMLLEMADQNPELGDAIDMALKNIRPHELEGFGIQTPLPALDPSAQSLAEQLNQNPDLLRDLIQTMESGQSSISEVLAIATMGEGATAALPTLLSRLETSIESNPQEAMVIGAVIERIQPDKPKSILTGMDLIPVIQGMDLSFANSTELGKLEGSLEIWMRQLMQSQIIPQQNLPVHAERLKDIHHDLYEQFVRAMLKQDARWKSVLSNSP